MTNPTCSNQKLHHVSTRLCGIWRAPSFIITYKAVPMLTGERLEHNTADDYQSPHLLIQCEQQTNNLPALVHVKKDLYQSPQFIEHLSTALSSLDRVNSQLLNICGLLIYDHTHRINIKTFNTNAYTSQICEFSIYPFFSIKNNDIHFPPPESTIYFERIIGNTIQPYMFENLQISADTVFQTVIQFYLSIL
ncbi:hypothetical protein [Alkalicoccobacillus murimartini]|uniref:Uncharacterized protein n=1 Tax=Alkalicoccobacillus murimartini TaxID=171685 RepID=A0ABT9YFX7_9BACI|nr:hypothetical protein [Alkalicoccobacillus murimartini]MDQ0206763.1 hypothetical protein [Alkalicoccobacillus murimartini]